MCTGHSLTVSPSMLCSGGMPAPEGYLVLGGCLVQGDLLLGGLLLEGTCSRVSGGCLVPGVGVSGPRGGEVPGPRGSGIPACTEADPPWTEFLTHTSENITLPQISFAGSNNRS